MDEASAVPEANIGTVLDRQSDLLARWQELGQELRRRSYDLPLDLRFELTELIRETSA
jgi:hypothetical protein